MSEKNKDIAELLEYHIKIEKDKLIEEFHKAIDEECEKWEFTGLNKVYVFTVIESLQELKKKKWEEKKNESKKEKDSKKDSIYK